MSLMMRIGALITALLLSGGATAHKTPIEAATSSLAGRLLVATPELQDPNFYRTVVYMVEHDARGALGVVINRELGSGPLGKLLAVMGAEEGADIETEVRIYEGGPVQRDRGFVLYSADYPHGGTVMFDEIEAQVARLPEIALKRGTYEGLIAFGYAGWGANQLESEIARGSWFTIPADEALLFDDAVATKWQRALARRGLDL